MSSQKQLWNISSTRDVIFKLLTTFKTAICFSKLILKYHSYLNYSKVTVYLYSTTQITLLGGDCYSLTYSSSLSPISISSQECYSNWSAFQQCINRVGHISFQRYAHYHASLWIIQIVTISLLHYLHTIEKNWTHHNITNVILLLQ